jgi:hypothetical protein
MNRFRHIFTIFAFSLLVLLLPSMASAQWRNDDDYYRTGSNNNRALQSTVRNLRNSSRNLDRQIERELDRGRYNDRRRDDRIVSLARDFRNATDNLDRRFGNGRNLNNSRNEARRVLDIGRQLDRTISRARLSNSVQNDWNRISRDLRYLADAYNYRDNRRTSGGIFNFPFPF